MFSLVLDEGRLPRLTKKSLDKQWTIFSDCDHCEIVNVKFRVSKYQIWSSKVIQ